MKKLSVIIISAVLLTACSQTAPLNELVPTATRVGTVTSTPTRETLPVWTPGPTQTPLPTFSPTPKPSPLPVPTIHELQGAIYETVIQIPNGEDGIQYRGAGVEDMEPVGPNGLVVTADGVFIIGDVNGNRLLRFDALGDRLEDIDLTPLGILNISDMVGAGDALYILEVSFKVLPERYRVNQLNTEGKLVNQYDLPKGFHFEDGLFGLAIGHPVKGEAEVLIQLGAGAESRYYRLPDTVEKLPEALPAMPVYGKDLHLQNAGPGELAILELGDQEFESQMSEGGTIFLLSPRVDGSLYLHREDLTAWEPAITTDITIHYISPDGRPEGVARYPLMDWYFHIWRFLTLGPDGNVYALITREKSVDVLRLNFYRQLDPILPGAAEPVIREVFPDQSPGQTYNCSLVNRLPPDSPEAQEILTEFLDNFRQDWPTEYMEFEQIWKMDWLEEYAVIQGLVTPQESDIIVVQEEERGYVMVSRYHANMILPGFRHSDIPGYLAAQLPDAPLELFYCLDLDRFTSN